MPEPLNRLQRQVKYHIYPQNFGNPESKGHIRESSHFCQILMKIRLRFEDWIMKSTTKYNQGFAKFPDSIINTIGRFLGTVAYYVDIRHRRISQRNLVFAYPDWSKEHVRKVSRRVFQHIGITFLEILQMTFMGREKILQKVTVKNGHYFNAAINDENGVIIISAHIGNWEMANVFISAYFKISIGIVARALDSQRMDCWINRIRSKSGNEIWPKKGALSKMARSLRNGGVVGMLIDQDTRDDESVQIEFFNHKANATPAAALLARRYDAVVLPLFCRRGADGRLVLEVQAPLTLVKTKDRQSDIETNTQIMTDAVEKAVNAYPEHWFWVHKRWKRHHPELYPEDLARHERRKKKKRAKLNKAKMS
jgi:Kdo2-lipid IVA lauroyltransferase/acyltransferase